MKRVALALAFAGFLAAPATGSPDLPDGKWWKRPRIAAAVNLTADQAREIEAIFSKARPQLIDRKADLEKKQGALEDALDSSADRKEIAARVEEVEDARAELQKARILMVLDMKHVLRPEQWDRLMKMREDARRQRLDGSERFGGRDRQFGRGDSPGRERRSSPRP